MINKSMAINGKTGFVAATFQIHDLPAYQIHRVCSY